MGSACQWKPRVTAERQLVTLCFVPAVAAAQRHLRRAKSASFSSALLFLFLAAARIICTPAERIGSPNQPVVFTMTPCREGDSERCGVLQIS